LIKVSGDDSVLGTVNPINIEEYQRLFNKMFTIELELESFSNPGENKVVFLGSTWKDGKPYRDINRLFARILFGTGNFPKMSGYELFCSRAYEIFGNDCRFGDIWRTFGLPLSPRIFRFTEIADYSNQLKIRELQKTVDNSDSRGI